MSGKRAFFPRLLVFLAICCVMLTSCLAAHHHTHHHTHEHANKKESEKQHRTSQQHHQHEHGHPHHDQKKEEADSTSNQVPVITTAMKQNFLSEQDFRLDLKDASILGVKLDTLDEAEYNVNEEFNSNNNFMQINSMDASSSMEPTMEPTEDANNGKLFVVVFAVTAVDCSVSCAG